MALQKASVGIPFGQGGADESIGRKLLDPPALAALVDARWDKRGELAKRYGTTALASTGIDPTNEPNSAFEHDGTLLQYGADGTSAWLESLNAWATDPHGPRPARVITDPFIRGNGSYKDADIAYDSDSGHACVVYRDDDSGAVVARLIDVSTGASLLSDELPSDIAEEPRVLAFGGNFVVLGDDGSGNIYASVSSAAGGLSFGAAVLVHTSTGNETHFDAHVASDAQTHGHVCVGLTGGWVTYQVDSAGAVTDSMLNPASTSGHAVAVLHNPNVGLVYVLCDDRSPAPDQLSLCRFADDYSGSASKTKALDYTVIPSNAGERRVTLAKTTSNGLWCFVSHGTADGGRAGGIDFVRTDSGGTPAVSSAFVPNLVLVTQAATVGTSRVIVGASREVMFAPPDELSDIGEREPLPSGFLLTPAEDEHLAVVGRFGHDTIACERRRGQSEEYLGSLVDINDELWAPFRTITASNPGVTGGEYFGIDLLRCDPEPAPVEHASAEGLALQAGGCLGAWDGQKSTELSIPVAPHAPIWNQGIVALASGAVGTHYALTPTWGPDGGTNYTFATMNFKYCFRWVDAQGNIRRSPMSAERLRTFYVDHAGGGGLTVLDIDNNALTFYEDPPSSGTYVPIEDDTRILLIPKPSPTALRPDGDTRVLVELYRTAPKYQQWTAVAGTGNDTFVQEEIRGAEDEAFRLVGILPIGDVTGYPNLGWIEDPTINCNDEPTTEAPQPYDDAGELQSEPTPAFLDVCSTQQRLFGIDAEDRLSVWFTKPFVRGYAPEWNGAYRFRCAAEGGELVACEVLDDKLVLFKERRIYVTPVLSGPDATGTGTAFQPPRAIASDTGCVNACSVASGPFGVVFESERGIYLLGRDLSISWIGEAMKESLAGRTIVAATVVPEATEVRFLLNDLKTPTAVAALVWDYRLNAWSTWKNVGGVHGTTWRGRWVSLQDDGAVHYEDSATYAAPGATTRPFLEATTAWIKIAQGLQGYVRVWSATILGDYLTGDLSIDVGFDYDTTWTDTFEFTQATLSALTRFQIKLRPSKQKCMAIRFRIRERALGSPAPTTGRGFVLQGLQLECGVKKGSYKLIPDAGRG